MEDLNYVNWNKPLNEKDLLFQFNQKEKSNTYQFVQLS